MFSPRLLVTVFVLFLSTSLSMQDQVLVTSSDAPTPPPSLTVNKIQPDVVVLPPNKITNVTEIKPAVFLNKPSSVAKNTNITNLVQHSSNILANQPNSVLQASPFEKNTNSSSMSAPLMMMIILTAAIVLIVVIILGAVFIARRRFSSWRLTADDDLSRGENGQMKAETDANLKGDISESGSTDKCLSPSITNSDENVKQPLETVVSATEITLTQTTITLEKPEGGNVNEASNVQISDEAVVTTTTNTATINAVVTEKPDKKITDSPLMTTTDESAKLLMSTSSTSSSSSDQKPAICTDVVLVIPPTATEPALAEEVINEFNKAADKVEKEDTSDAEKQPLNQ